MLMNEAMKLEIYVLFGTQEASVSDARIAAKNLLHFFDIEDPGPIVDGISYLFSAALLILLL